MISFDVILLDYLNGGCLKSFFKRLVIAGLTRNPLKINVRFSGDPASSAG
jgi:hypothetical protein